MGKLDRREKKDNCQRKGNPHFGVEYCGGGKLGGGYEYGDPAVGSRRLCRSRPEDEPMEVPPYLSRNANSQHAYMVGRTLVEARAPAVSIAG